ncbi:MAG: hypothetical protein V3S42_01350, partial [Candidatus Neomarinimicrobiota bacterium]
MQHIRQYHLATIFGLLSVLVLDLDRISDEYEFVLNDYFRMYPRKIVIPNEFEIRYIEVDSPREIKISLDDYSVRTIH